MDGSSRLSVLQRRAIAILCGWVVLVGVLVICGWSFGLYGVTNVFPNFPSMKTTTALLFVALAFSVLVLALSRSRDHSSMRRLAGSTAILTIAVSIVHLVANGNDATFVPPNSRSFWGYRMSLSTSLCFLFTAAWLLFCSLGRAQSWRRYLLLGTLATAYLSLAGAGLAPKEFYALKPFSTMAVHTIALHLILGAAAIVYDPGAYLRNILQAHTPDVLLVRRLLPIVLLAPLLLGWLRLLGERQGYYPSSFGVAITTTVLAGVLLVGTLSAARVIRESEQERLRLQAHNIIQAKVLAATEEELRHSQKMESLGHLTTGVAHDFNNLLMIILGYANIAEDILPPNSRAGDSVRQIEIAAERASGLTRQLLSFSRRQASPTRVSDVNQIVSELIRMSRRLVGNKISVEATLEGGARVRIDPGHLGQIILNLVVNAKDAMPSGGTLTITTRVEASDPSPAIEDGSIDPASTPSDRLVLTIEDTGMGMNPATRARIFEPFFTTKPSGRGTGLGLSVVQGIVQQAGGTIDVKSSANQGTTFRVSLPIHSEEVPDSHKLSDQVIGGHEAILVVDDDIQLAELLGALLRRFGYAVEVCTTGEDALRVLSTATEGFALLLTDLDLPGISGIRLGHDVRIRFPATRILFFSGSPESAEELFQRLGPVDLMEKPVLPAALLRQIRVVLDRPAPPSPFEQPARTGNTANG